MNYVQDFLNDLTKRGNRYSRKSVIESGGEKTVIQGFFYKASLSNLKTFRKIWNSAARKLESKT